MKKINLEKEKLKELDELRKKDYEKFIEELNEYFKKTDFHEQIGFITQLSESGEEFLELLNELKQIIGIE